MAQETPMVECVVVLVAMEEEAMPFIIAHGLQRHRTSPFLPGAPMVAYSGVICSTRVHLVWSGKDMRFKCNNVATQASAVSTYASIAAFAPDLVISAGTAGGFGNLGASIGDVYIRLRLPRATRKIHSLRAPMAAYCVQDRPTCGVSRYCPTAVLPLAPRSSKCIFHSRRIPEAGGRGTLEESGFGHFRAPPIVFELAARLKILKLGVVSTSDSLDCSAIDLQLLRAEGAVVKEMEAAAEAKICQELRVNFFALKSVTDIVDGQEATADEFYSNLGQASEALQRALSNVISIIGEYPASVASAPPLLQAAPSLSPEPVSSPPQLQKRPKPGVIASAPPPSRASLMIACCGASAATVAALLLVLAVAKRRGLVR